MDSTFDRGDQALLSVSFATLPDKTAADPKSITLEVMSPSGALSKYIYGDDAELLRTSTGQYRLFLTLIESGDWQYRWSGTGELVAAAFGTIRVKKDIFG